MSGPVSTWMGDRLGIRDAVGMELFYFCESNWIEVFPKMGDTTWTTMYYFGISWKWKERIFYWILPTRRPPTSLLLKDIWNAVREAHGTAERLVRWRFLRAALSNNLSGMQRKLSKGSNR